MLCLSSSRTGAPGAWTCCRRSGCCPPPHWATWRAAVFPACSRACPPPHRGTCPGRPFPAHRAPRGCGRHSRGRRMPRRARSGLPAWTLPRPARLRRGACGRLPRPAGQSCPLPRVLPPVPRPVSRPPPCPARSLCVYA